MQRTRAREVALFALYRSEFLPDDAAEMMTDEDVGDQGTYINELLRGIERRRGEIDSLLRSRTVGWRLERLALLDRNILRIGVYELLYSQEIPPEVAIDAAVELAKKYGTDQARAFVNGILDRVWKEERERAVD